MKKKTVKNIILMLILAMLVTLSAGCTDDPVYMGGNTSFGPTPTHEALSFIYSHALLNTTAQPEATPVASVTEKPVTKREEASHKEEEAQSIKATPVPTRLAGSGTGDNVNGIVSRLRRHNSIMGESTPEGLYIYCDSEKKANVLVSTASQSYSMFPVLYSDQSIMHTPEYYMELYPEITSLSVDYSRSGIYANGIVLCFTNIETKAAGALLAAIRTGNESSLSKNDKWTLNEIRRISSELGLSKMSDIDKTYTVYNYIVTHCAYDSDASSSSHKAYGLLKNGKAVCDGYAEAFMLFMVVNGVEAEVITGKADSGPHAWNQVKIGENWYNLDLTWDDPIDSTTGEDIPDHVFYKYFMLDDKEMGRTHTAESSFTHSCNDKSYRLYGYMNVKAENESEILDVISSQLSKKYVTVAVPSEKADVSTVLGIYQSVTGKSSTYFPAYTVDGYKIIEIRN